jgi:hypothetical protein
MNALNHLLVRAHQDNLLREAEAHRQSHQVEPVRKPNATLAALGRNLVTLGEHLTTTGTVAQTRPAKSNLQPES